MNTIQITRALKQDPMTSKTFCGVFPSDKLPQRNEKYPCGIVANTDPSEKTGEHWIAMFISFEQKESLKKGSFFDPLGKSPEFYGTSFTNFLNEHVAHGNLIIVSCKAIGQLFVGNIVCFIYIKGHGDIA